MKEILQPVISKDNAGAIFQNLTQKKLLKIIPAPGMKALQLELMYLPFYIFEVTTEDRGEARNALFSADGIQGAVVPFSPVIEVYAESTGIRIRDFVLSKERAEDRIGAHMKGLALEQSMKLRRTISVKRIEYKQKLQFPFWIVYFQKKEKYDFKAIDAISGEFTPLTMRQVFLNIFRQEQQFTITEE
jgi:uncharacterized protein YkuJ